MSFVRLLLIVVLTLSATLSTAMETGDAPMSVHDDAAVETALDDASMCCQDSGERAQTCHVLAAVLVGTLPIAGGPTTARDVVRARNVLMTGHKPAGPLDPPRSV